MYTVSKKLSKNEFKQHSYTGYIKHHLIRHDTYIRPTQGCMHIYKFLINKLIKKCTAQYWISLKKKKNMHSSLIQCIKFQKKKKVTYLDLNKALSGRVSNDTIPVDKWSG